MRWGQYKPVEDDTEAEDEVRVSFPASSCRPTIIYSHNTFGGGDGYIAHSTTALKVEVTVSANHHRRYPRVLLYQEYS
jgi:hypothetical protein